MAYSPVATFGFVGTNYNKVSGGDWTRYPVLGGQCANALEYSVNTCAEKSSIFAGLKTKAASKFSSLAKSDKVFNGIFKSVKFVQNNINPLIVVSGITKVALAKKEDREKTFFSEGGMIAGMFLGEGWMKKNLEPKVLSKLPVSKKWAPVVKGVLFVAGSLLASTIGQTAGEAGFKLLEKNRRNPVSSNTPVQKAQQPEALQTAQHVYEPLEIKA